MGRMFKIGTLMAFALCLLASCSTTRYVGEGQSLLNAVRVKALGSNELVNTANLRNYVRQRPNARWFSLVRLPLLTYSLSGSDTTKWVNRTLRAIGEAPVIYDSLKAELSKGRPAAAAAQRGIPRRTGRL